MNIFQKIIRYREISNFMVTTCWLISTTTTNCSTKITHSWLFLFSVLLRSSKMESSTNHHADKNLATFRLLYTVVQLIGLALIVTMAVWVFVFLGGLSWSATPSIQFNWHPLLMTIGMIFLYGNCKYSILDTKWATFFVKWLCDFSVVYFYSDFGLSWLPICAQT